MYRGVHSHKLEVFCRKVRGDEEHPLISSEIVRMPITDAVKVI
jgi:hypothetical protein